MLSAREFRHLADYVEMNPLLNGWGDGMSIPLCPANFVAADRWMRAAGFEHWFSANPRATRAQMPVDPGHHVYPGARDIFQYLGREFPLFMGGPLSIFSYGEEVKLAFERDPKEHNRKHFAMVLRAEAEKLEKAEHKAMVKPTQVTASEDQYMVTGIDPAIEWELTTVTA